MEIAVGNSSQGIKISITNLLIIDLKQNRGHIYIFNLLNHFFLFRPNFLGQACLLRPGHSPSEGDFPFFPRSLRLVYCPSLLSYRCTRR